MLDLKQMSHFLPSPFIQSASTLHVGCQVGMMEQKRQPYIVIIGIKDILFSYWHCVSQCDNFSLGCLGMKQ